MNLSLFIARRYFRSKKKRNFISIISNISMVGVAVGTMALVIVLSVFNGLEEMIRSFYGTFDPDLKVEAVKGKFFEVNEPFLEQIKNTEGVEVVTEVIEDNALVRYKDAQQVVKLKGVSPNYTQQQHIDKAIINGEFKLEEKDINYAVIGIGIRYTLGVAMGSDFYTLQVYYPKKGKIRGTTDPSKLTNRKLIKPSGVFNIERAYDDFMFVPLDFAQELCETGNKRTSLEIKVKNEANILEVKDLLSTLLGSNFKVQTRDEQHASILRAIKIEKLFVFIILSFILGIVSFNTFFSLSMLAIEKKKDISVLYSMGADHKTIRRIFLFEGALISFTGAFLGLILGLLVCWLQQTFGLISMGMQTGVVDAYPVKMQALDFLYTSISIIVITFLASYRPAHIATKTEINTYL
ncbi:ABC transporter permease [Xanthovirga aplysinae]|uniref:ABC transporter permease n=1 Tax=Xanthovirga aplysinae TaxID=2529853 RepID=UPI0012BD4938|nr:ABC transporter permease [Xanthovirga aplysinae]MTI32206.1 ABC transporter permease [Xanthovirga aplysinae]